MAKNSSIKIYLDEKDDLYLCLSNIYKKNHPKSNDEKKQILEDYLASHSSPSLLNFSDLENLKNLTAIIFSLVKINQKLQGNYQIEIDKFYGEVYSSKKVIVDFLNEKLNSIQNSYSLEESTDKTYLLKNKKSSIVSSAWIQLSGAISNGKYLKICNHTKCNDFFSTSRIRMAYCTSKCQTRAKSFRAYHGEINPVDIKVQEEGSRNAEEEKVNRLNKEKFFIPKEYDADFGFFDGQDEKERILGS